MMAERTLLMVKLISNFARLIPEFDSEKGHHIAMSDSPWFKYPQGFPVVHMEGTFKNNDFFVADGSILTLTHGNVITKLKERHRLEWQGVDENGELVWIDEEAMREEYWRKQCEDDGHEFLDVRKAFYFELEEINLPRCEKRKYKIELDTIEKMDPLELFDYIDYADPNIIKIAAAREMRHIKMEETENKT